MLHSNGLVRNLWLADRAVHNEVKGPVPAAEKGPSARAGQGSGAKARKASLTDFFETECACVCPLLHPPIPNPSSLPVTTRAVAASPMSRAPSSSHCRILVSSRYKLISLQHDRARTHAQPTHSPSRQGSTSARGVCGQALRASVAQRLFANILSAYLFRQESDSLYASWSSPLSINP